MSKFTEELLSKRLKKPSGPIRDSSSPKLAGYLSATDVSEYQDKVLDLNIECWYSLIEPCTFPTHFHPIRLEDARLFVDIYERIFKGKEGSTDIGSLSLAQLMALLEPRQVEQLLYLQERLDKCLSALNAGQSLYLPVNK